MLAIIDEFYEHENTFVDSVLPKQDYEQMTAEIKGAYESIIKKVDGIAAKVIEKKASVELKIDAELRHAINDIQVTKEELLQKLS